MKILVWFTALVVLVTTGVLPDVESRPFGEEGNFHVGLEPRLDRLESPKKQPELLDRFMAEMEERDEEEEKGGIGKGIGERMGEIEDRMGEIDEKKQLDGEKEETEIHKDFEEPRLDPLASPEKQPEFLTRFMAEMEEKAEMEERAQIEEMAEKGEIDGEKGELDGETEETEEHKDIEEEMECAHCEKIRKLKKGIQELLGELDCDEGIREDRPDKNFEDIKIPEAGPFFGSFEGRVPGY